MDWHPGFLFVDYPQLEDVWFPASARIVDIYALNTTLDPNITTWVPAGSRAREVAGKRGWNWKERRFHKVQVIEISAQ